MKVPGQSVGNVVGQARNVVKARDVSVVPLVHAEQAEEVRGRGVAGGTALPLPERRIQVVALAQDGALADVEQLGNRLKVDEAPRKLKVGVGYCSCWVFVRDKKTGDELWPLESSQ